MRQVFAAFKQCLLQAKHDVLMSRNSHKYFLTATFKHSWPVSYCYVKQPVLNKLRCTAHWQTQQALGQSFFIKPKRSSKEYMDWQVSVAWIPFIVLCDKVENRLGRKMGRAVSHTLGEIDSFPIFRLPSLPSVQSLAAPAAIVKGSIQINQI